VYAFDLRTGEQIWSGPAVVKQRGMMLSQPQDLPLLVFVDREMRRDASGGGSHLRLLCLDKATGRTVFRNDDLKDTAGGRFDIRVAGQERPTVSIDMSSQTVQLTLTDEPRPPEPPANDQVEAPRDNSQRGLWGIGQRMGSAIQGALQNPPAVEDARPAAPPGQNRNPAPAAPPAGNK
jgi:hypothetical protein